MNGYLLCIYVVIFVIIWSILGIKLEFKKVGYLKSLGINLTVIIIGFLVGVIPIDIGKCGNNSFYFYNIYKTARIYGKGTIYVEVPDGLKKLIVNNGVEKVKSCQGYKNLKDVKIPSTVVEIGYSAFNNCENLDNIIIPDKDIEIACNAFKGCNKVKNIKFGNNVHIYETDYQYYNFDSNEGLGLTDRGFIDKKGKLVIDLKDYSNKSYFSEGLAVVSKRYKSNEKYGYIDNKGNVVIPLEFDSAEDFSEELACVKKDEKYGYIDKSGNICIDFKYKIARWFCNGLAYINTDNEYGYIDKEGNLIIDDKIWVEDFEI